MNERLGLGAISQNTFSKESTSSQELMGCTLLLSSRASNSQNGGRFELNNLHRILRQAV